MAAFYSSTDDRDDTNAIGFSGVVGKLKDKEPEVKIRFNYYKQKYEVKLSDIVEEPVDPSTNIPDEWLANVNTPVYPSYHGYQGGAHTNRNYDHLKPYQFQGGKQTSPTTQSGERAGPGMREIPDYRKRYQESLLNDEYGVEDLAGFHWGVQGQSTRDPLLLEKLAENNAVQTVEPSKTQCKGNTQFPPEAVGGMDDDEFAFLTLQYGGEVANAVSLINDCMTQLSGKQELLSTAVSDMFELMEEEDQLNMVKDLFKSLPFQMQQKIAESGM